MNVIVKRENVMKVITQEASTQELTKLKNLSIYH